MNLKNTKLSLNLSQIKFILFNTTKCKMNKKLNKLFFSSDVCFVLKKINLLCFISAF